MRSSYRDLVAYQRATTLANQIHRVVVAWPKFEKWSLGMQLIRAADSVGANIAEAAGRWHVRDRRQLLVVARGSLYETEHWLGAADDRGLVNPIKADDLDEVARTLQGLIHKHTPS